MKVIKTNELPKGRIVRCPNDGFTSRRLLLESDGMGFTVTHTTIPKGDPQFWHYKNHLEACYCIEGAATLTNLTTGEEHHITPGVMYALDKHDPHQFQAHETTVLICVFNPPLVGREVHGVDGSYKTGGDGNV